MTEKEFDDILRHKLGEFREEFDPESWSALEQRLDETSVPGDTDFDEAVRAALTGFTSDGVASDWDLMAQRLDAEDELAFDKEVQDKVSGYTAPYDPASWPILSDRISEEERMRRRLIGAKVLEVAAVLIALLTLVNVLPVLHRSINDSQEVAENFAEETISGSELISMTDHAAALTEPDHLSLNPVSSDDSSGEIKTLGISGNDRPDIQAESSAVTSTGDQTTGYSKADFRADASSLDRIQRLGTVYLGFDYLELPGNQHHVEPHLRGSESAIGLQTLALPESVDPSSNHSLPYPELPSRKRNIRMSLGVALDINHLHMPDDQFYADGRKIKFSEKDLIATGYTLGATVIFDKQAWSFETGIQYSQKGFEPNRVLQLGKTFDVRTVDFDKISMHFVTVPLNAFWNFDRKGKTHVYLVGGASLNLIAAAHYDLLTRGSLDSAPPGGSRTDYEVARVREHFLDGAEFSSKASITANAGIGVEYYLNKKFSLFAQPSFSYQVPVFVLSDKEGKQLQFLSLQIGTRVRLK